jgi:hypothetical protein
MSDVLAARYCDYSESQFHKMVGAGIISRGKKVPGTTLVRWHKSVLDQHITTIHGVIDIETMGDAASQAGAQEWLDSLNETGP